MPTQSQSVFYAGIANDQNCDLNHYTKPDHQRENSVNLTCWRACVLVLPPAFCPAAALPPDGI